MYDHDNRVVITLDAGGTNFVFGAMQGQPLHRRTPSPCPHTPTIWISVLATDGRRISGRSSTGLRRNPVAISFAFPGPADYPNGIIGGYLPNVPVIPWTAWRWGPFLEATFGIPVFINNDGDLFAYGEALGGALPQINARLVRPSTAPNATRTCWDIRSERGFGIGIVVDNRLNRGDNSCVESFCLRHKKYPTSSSRTVSRSAPSNASTAN